MGECGCGNYSGGVKFPGPGGTIPGEWRECVASAIHETIAEGNRRA